MTRRVDGIWLFISRSTVATAGTAIGLHVSIGPLINHLLSIDFPNSPHLPDGLHLRVARDSGACCQAVFLSVGRVCRSVDSPVDDSFEDDPRSTQSGPST